MVRRDDTCELVDERSRIDPMIESSIDRPAEKRVPCVEVIAGDVPATGLDERCRKEDDRRFPAS